MNGLSSQMMQADDYSTDWYGYVCSLACHKAQVTKRHGIEVLE